MYNYSELFLITGDDPLMVNKIHKPKHPLAGGGNCGVRSGLDYFILTYSFY